jgi:hypothetical protein
MRRKSIITFCLNNLLHHILLSETGTETRRKAKTTENETAKVETIDYLAFVLLFGLLQIDSCYPIRENRWSTVRRVAPGPLLLYRDRIN